jgi:suppressor for copper-sensitivity B
MDADALVVRLASGGAPLEHPDAIVEAPAGLYFGKPAVEVVDGGAAAVLSLPLTRDGNAPDPATSEITLTAFDGERALERKLVLATFTGVGPAAVVPALLPMILVALLGGLILNAMPCVLPVLVLKLSSVLEQAGVAAADTRRSFLATAAGIMTAFVTLGTILIGIRLAGYGVGWGIQFQQPLFLALLAAICLAFAANVWGWFEIGVPGFAGALANAADRQPGKPLRGAFLNGVLASVLATPCSAPFVGVAVGYALSRGTGEILVIFLALGAGLAAPYFTIAAMPGLVAWLPRPGRWMLWLKRLLGVSLAGMGLWLLFILGGIAGVLPATGPGPERIAWQRFDASTIPGLVDSGHVVFVDVTADWCLTCRANKEFVLSRDPVASALGGIVAMKADWTSPDPEISAYLARFSRYGIPMNVVYGPGAPDGILLPELLGSDAVIAALEKAK